MTSQSLAISHQAVCRPRLLSIELCLIYPGDIERSTQCRELFARQDLINTSAVRLTAHLPRQRQSSAIAAYTHAAAQMSCTLLKSGQGPHFSHITVNIIRRVSRGYRYVGIIRLIISRTSTGFQPCHCARYQE